MKYKVLLLSIALLSCFSALFYTLSIVASAGTGCGTNWMGDTTGDTDFSVSKNQNQGTTSDASSAAATASKPIVALGSTGTKAVQSAGIDSLTPSAASPQKPGTVIVWTASATNPGTEPLLYDFLLRGQGTDGLLTDKTGWTARNSWTWNTTSADAGDNQVEVRIKYASSVDAVASKTESFSVSSAAQSGADAKDSGTATGSETVSSGVAQSSDNAIATAADSTATTANAHPESKTSGSIESKPRVSPDERKKETSSDITGANMNMPDPSPKTSAQNTAQTTQVPPSVTSNAETAEPKVMEVDGKWTVKLVDAASSMDLILIQTGKSVSGWGNLEEKSTKLPLIATGSVSDNSINLDIKTVVGEYVNKVDKRFKIDLVKVDRVVSGSYEAYSGEDLSGKGKATASRI
jgi:hypothetical protein